MYTFAVLRKWLREGFQRKLKVLLDRFCLGRACGLPPTLINGFLTDITGVETNDNATYQCVPGLTLDGPNVSTCLNGNWTRPGECRGM